MIVRRSRRPIPCRRARIIYGAGAVGSAIGGRLRQGGADVALVGRPAHVTAIRDNGLTRRTAKGRDVVEVEAVASIDQL